MADKLLYFFLIFSFFACGPKGEKPQAPLVLAFVNGNSIKEDELRFHLNLEKFDDKTYRQSDRFDAFKKEILDRLIRNHVIIEWGMKQGIMLTDEELARGMEEMKKGYTAREFERMLEEKNIPLIKWRNMSEEELHVEKIIHETLGKNAVVSQAEIQNYYHTHLNDFAEPESVRVRHIVTDTPEKASELRQKIMAGENFAKMAIMHSLSPDRSQGGELGPFHKGTYPKAFDICFDLQPGEISPVITSPYGYHIFKVIEKKPKGVRSLEEASQEIASHLAQEKLRKGFDAWYAKIRSEAQIQVIEEELEKVKP